MISIPIEEWLKIPNERKSILEIVDNPDGQPTVKDKLVEIEKQDSTQVRMSELTPNHFKKGFYLLPCPCMINGQFIDRLSGSLAYTIYESLNIANKKKFTEEVCKDSFKLAKFLECMWELPGIKISVGGKS